ncbi:MAG: hypothetical protein WD512_18840, partial [Candidatus Paceibacterota bacterium]
MNFLMIDWIWESVLAPNSYGWVLPLILVSLFIEDAQRVIWPMPVLYMYMIWNYNYVSTGTMFTYISNHWLNLMFFLIGYLLFGFIWSVIKLKIYVSSDKYNKKIYVDHNQSLNQPIYADKRAEDIVHENKSRILGWIIYWPLS